MSFLIGHAIDKVAPHHFSIQALWEKKWKKPCSMGIYPFEDGNIEDFEKVFTELAYQKLREPYDYDAYASAFFPIAEGLLLKAERAKKNSDIDGFCNLSLRAAAVYRMARFPIMKSPKQHEAWKRGKEAFFRCSSYLEAPIHEVNIHHTNWEEGDLAKSIPVSLRLPSTKNSGGKFPVVIVMCGLDHFRTDLADRTSHLVKRGWASIVVEIPGTADCPASPSDPRAADRLWSSLLQWIQDQTYLDANNVVVYGLSTGGYYAWRAARTHHKDIRAVVSQGGGCDRMFDPEWLSNVDHLEYPFDLLSSMAQKFGYHEVDTFVRESKKKWSLKETGILDLPCTRLLTINGMDDEIFPIEDCLIQLQHGDASECRLYPGLKHMGEPLATAAIMRWISSVIGAWDS